MCGLSALMIISGFVKKINDYQTTIELSIYIQWNEIVKLMWKEECLSDDACHRVTQSMQIDSYHVFYQSVWNQEMMGAINLIPMQ